MLGLPPCADASHFSWLMAAICMAQMDAPRSEDPVEATPFRKDEIEESCVIKLGRPEDGPSVSPNPLPAEPKMRSSAFLQNRACEDDDAPYVSSCRPRRSCRNQTDTGANFAAMNLTEARPLSATTSLEKRC